MRQQIKHGTTFPMLEVVLEPGEVLVAEAGSMVARDERIGMEVKLNAGAKAGVWGMIVAFFVALIRKAVGGETFFVNHFSSPQGGWVWLSPALSGGIRHITLQGQSMIFSAGAFLASSNSLALRMRWGGLRALFAREGLFFIEVGGTGDLWVNSYGAIEEVEVKGKYIVDTGHIVGFDSNLDFQIRAAGGGLMGFVASGEGLVCEFSGRGKLLLQTRNTQALVGWITPLLPA